MTFMILVGLMLGCQFAQLMVLHHQNQRIKLLERFVYHDIKSGRHEVDGHFFNLIEPRSEGHHPLWRCTRCGLRNVSAIPTPPAPCDGGPPVP